MSAPKFIPNYKFTDYQNWEGSWELWDGVAVAMTPSPFGTHQKALTRLGQLFLNALDVAECKECDVVVELDWIVSENTVVRPDLSLCCNSNIDRFIETPPTLIAEILSESTEHKDRTAKRSLYAEQGVLYYLMLNVDTRSVELLRLVGESYETMEAADVVEFHLSSGCTIPLKRVQILAALG
jgi:Uma2 family endonuclease